MRKIITSIFTLATLVALASCSKASESVADVAPASEFCNISIATSAGEATVSKSTETSDFDDGSTIGLAIYKAGSETIHSYTDTYYNIKGTYDADATDESGKWSYNFLSDSWVETYPQISLKTADEDCKLYGYYPFNSAVTDITAVPFAVSNNYAYMCGESGDDISINNTNQINIDMTFKQVMTRLRFKVKLKNTQGNVYLRYFVFETGTTQLITVGNFNAKTGDISATTESDSFTTTTESLSLFSDTEGVRDVYLAPFTLGEDEADDIKIRLCLQSYFIIDDYITLDKGDVAAGVSHTINSTLDSFNKISSSISVDKTWDDVTIDWDEEESNGDDTAVEI